MDGDNNRPNIPFNEESSDDGQAPFTDDVQPPATEIQAPPTGDIQPPSDVPLPAHQRGARRYAEVMAAEMGISPDRLRLRKDAYLPSPTSPDLSDISKPRPDDIAGKGKQRATPYQGSELDLDDIATKQEDDDADATNVTTDKPTRKSGVKAFGALSQQKTVEGRRPKQVREIALRIVKNACSIMRDDFGQVAKFEPTFTFPENQPLYDIIESQIRIKDDVLTNKTTKSLAKKMPLPPPFKKSAKKDDLKKDLENDDIIKASARSLRDKNNYNKYHTTLRTWMALTYGVPDAAASHADADAESDYDNDKEQTTAVPNSPTFRNPVKAPANTLPALASRGPTQEDFDNVKNQLFAEIKKSAELQETLSAEIKKSAELQETLSAEIKKSADLKEALNAEIKKSADSQKTLSAEIKKSADVQKELRVLNKFKDENAENYNEWKEKKRAEAADMKANREKYEKLMEEARLEAERFKAAEDDAALYLDGADDALFSGEDSDNGISDTMSYDGDLDSSINANQRELAELSHLREFAQDCGTLYKGWKTRQITGLVNKINTAEQHLADLKQQYEDILSFDPTDKDYVDEDDDIPSTDTGSTNDADMMDLL